MDQASLNLLRTEILDRYKGCPAFVLASGPGLTPEVAKAIHARWSCSDALAIVVNDAWIRAPWAQWLYSSDDRWWRKHEGVSGYMGRKYSANPDCYQFPPAWNVSVLQGAHHDSFSFEFPMIHFGSNSGFSAINLALHAGCRRIVLAGFNMGPDGVQKHFDGCPDPAYQTDATGYDRFRKAFELAAADKAFKACGAEIVNATPGSHLGTFPIMKIEEALAWLG